MIGLTIFWCAIGGLLAFLGYYLILDFRGYSKEDLVESLYGYGYLNEDELISLEKFTNAWTIEEEA